MDGPQPVMSTTERRQYHARVEQQLVNWLGGQSLHNKVDDECCPDFSCCRPELAMPAEQRADYYRRRQPT